MTTATLATGNRTMTEARKAPAQPRRAGRPAHGGAVLGAAGDGTGDGDTLSVVKSVHEARRLRQAGDVEGALAILAGTDTTKAEPHQARWAFAEWTDLVRRRFGDRDGCGLQPGHGTGLPPWCPPTTAGRLRSRRSWGCAGGPASWSLGAACGVCGPWRRLALGPDRTVARRCRSASNGRRPVEATGALQCPAWTPGSSPSCDCLHGRSVPPGSTPHGGRCLPHPLPCGLRSLFTPTPHASGTGLLPDYGRGQHLCPDARRSLPRT